MFRSRMKKVAAAAAALVAMVTGAVVFGAASPASAALPVCSGYGSQYFYLDHVWVNSRWPGGAYDCNLRQGNTGNGVKVLQYLLACNNHAYLPDGRFVARDGNFGPITREAVRLMQLDLGVAADGEFGPITLNAVELRGSLPVFKDDAWWFYACA